MRVRQLTRYILSVLQGLGNPLSQLGVGSVIRDHLLAADHSSNILMLFGHVDIHIAYLYQLATRGEEALGPIEWSNKCLSAYENYLDEELVQNMHKVGGIKKLFVAGVTWPVVQDECEFPQTLAMHELTSSRYRQSWSVCCENTVTYVLLIIGTDSESLKKLKLAFKIIERRRRLRPFPFEYEAPL